MKLLVGKSGHLLKFIDFLETKKLPPNLKQQFKLLCIASGVSESLIKIFTQEKKENKTSFKTPPSFHFCFKHRPQYSAYFDT